jgi:hypothetical protein
MRASRVNPPCVDPSQELRSAASFKRSVVSPLGPGSSLANARSPGTRQPGERAKSRRAQRTVGRHPDSRCQTATYLSLLMVRSAARRVSNHQGTQVDRGPPILRDGPSGLLRMRRCWQSRDATQRIPLRSRRRVVAPGFWLFLSRPPRSRGGRSAVRRTMSVVAFARRDMIRA